MQHALKSFTLGALGLLLAGSLWGQKCTVDISPEFKTNGDGKMERQKVFSIKKDTGLLLVPERSKQISANELFFVTTGVFKLTDKNMDHVGVIRVN